MQNATYSATGYDVFELFSEDVEVQYEKIKALIRMKNKPTAGPLKTLELPAFERLKAKYLSEEGDSDNIKSLVASAKQMVATACAVMKDLETGQLSMTDSKGKLYN